MLMLSSTHFHLGSQNLIPSRKNMTQKSIMSLKALTSHDVSR